MTDDTTFVMRWSSARGEETQNGLEGVDAARFISKCKKTISELDVDFQDTLSEVSYFERLAVSIKSPFALLSMLEFAYFNKLKAHQLYACWSVIRGLLRNPRLRPNEYSGELANTALKNLLAHPELNSFIPSVLCDCPRLDEDVKEVFLPFLVEEEEMDVDEQ